MTEIKKKRAGPGAWILAIALVIVAAFAVSVALNLGMFAYVMSQKFKIVPYHYKRGNVQPGNAAPPAGPPK